jgi:hypothetical protein
MPNNDIRDLLGRYATGSLSTAERERLFDAALSDQELFEELAREQELKLLFEEPGARDRMIHALHPPVRKSAWLLGAGGVAVALGVVVLVLFLRPAPKPAQIAVVTTVPAPSAAAPVEPAAAPPALAEPAVDKVQPAAPAVPQLEKARAEDRKLSPPVGQPVVDQPASDAAPVAVATAAPAAPLRQLQAETIAPRAKQFAPQQQSPGGPRQNQVAQQSQIGGLAGAAASQSGFGFHYSVETKGHLVIVPGADGYLFVKAADGRTLYERQQIAAAITIDIPVPDKAGSVTITFSVDANPVETPASSRDAPSGSVEGERSLTITVKVP